MIGRLLKSVVLTSAVLTVALSAAIAPASATTPGWVDTTYGASGVGLVPGAVSGVTTVDAVGRALVLGATSGAGNGGQVTRLTAGGQVDTSFGSNGTLSLPPAVYYTRLTLDSAARIYVLGSDAPTGGPSTRFIVTRLTADGALDASFGSAGTATIVLDASVPPVTSNAFAVRNDGHVVVSMATSDAVKKGYLAALTPAGQLDTAFGPASTGIFPLPDKEFIFKLTAAPAPVAPVFTAATPPLLATRGIAYSYTFAANGTPPPTFAVATGALPNGLTLDPATGVLAGTPTATGDFVFTVKATNGVSPDAVTPSITIHVSPPNVSPVFTSVTPPATGKVGAAYTYTFAASGNPAPTFSVATGSLPPGLILNATTGVLSGTPTAGGVFTFTVKAANGIAPDAVSPSITINVAAAPAFTAVTPPTTAALNTSYSYTFAASGNPAPTFSVASGSLPTGLSLNAATGVLSGVPSVKGPFTFTVKAANGVAPDAVSPAITITVSPVRTAPVFTAASPPSSATVGVAYTYQFRANGYPAPTFSLLGNAPTGLKLNAATGVLSGKPTAAHTFVFRVKASNGVTPDAISPVIIITVARAHAASAATPAGNATASAAPAATAATTDPAVAPDPNNDVVALLANDSAASRTYVLQRYTSNGTLDSTFGTGGSTAAFATAVNPSTVVEAPNGSYYITGNYGQSVFLAHVLPNGQFDTAFGTGGVLAGPVESCKPTGGLIMLAGTDIYVLAINADPTCGVSPAILLRFHGGALDTTFGVGGEVRIDSVASMRVSGPNGGGLQPGGQVLVGINGATVASASAGVTRVNVAPSPPTIEAFTQLADDGHFGAAAVAPNPPGTYLGPLAAVADAAGATHVFAQGGDHHLYELTQSGSTWLAPADLTAATAGAPTLASAPKAILDGTTIDVFALSSTGDLVEYRNSGTNGTWVTVDISAVAPAGSPKVTSSIDPHVINGMVHIYGVSAAGDLVEVDNDNAGGHSWNFYDITTAAGGGTTIAGAPAALLIGGLTPHVYTRAASNNHLVEFVADHAGGRVWNAYDTTVAAPGAPPILGNPVPVLISTTPHVFAASAAPGSNNGDLVEYVADHLNSSVWNAYDQTAGSNAPKPIGNPSVVLIDGTPYGIATFIPEVWETAINGDLVTIVADQRGGHTWNVYDVTALSGGPQVTGDPTPIVNGGTVQVFGLGRASAGAAAWASLSTAGLGVAPVSSNTSPSRLLPYLPG